MAVLVISGSGRGVGKTAVGCSLIAALPELRWVGVKVSPHAHGVDEAVWEEGDRESAKDTGRYLASGARRAFLVTGESGCLCGVRAGEDDSLLVESNRFSLRDLAAQKESAVRLVVLGGVVGQWKDSLWDAVGEADAVVLTGGFPVERVPGELRWKRLFWMVRGKWSSPELVEFVRGRLANR